MSLSNSPVNAIAAMDNLKTNAVKILLFDITESLQKIHHPGSGRVMETVLQFLPDPSFDALAFLVIGKEEEEFVVRFIYSILSKLIARQGIEIESDADYITAGRSLMLLITLESMRRKGQIEYLWPEDFFKETPTDMSFTKLTATGKAIAQEQLLKIFQGGKYKQ